MVITANEIAFEETPFIQGTVGASENRLNWRAKKLLSDNQALIRNRRILDIASNDGRFSYACLKLGAKHVYGVEGRQKHVDEANRYFSELGHPVSEYQFDVGDIFDFLSKCEPGQFDTILCFGFLYHTIRQVEMFQEFQRLMPKNIILDSYVHPQRKWIRWLRTMWRFRPKHLRPDRLKQLVQTTEADVILQVAMEDATKDGSSIVSGGTPVREIEKSYGAMAMNFHPTSAALERLADYHGFETQTIRWKGSMIGDWAHLDDYRTERRVSYILSPRVGSGLKGTGVADVKASASTTCH